MLFVVSTALHGYLYQLRPAPLYLTLCYLVLSAGGGLGGLFASLVAPLLFDWVYEHPLLILAAALLLPLPRLIPWDSAFVLSPRRAQIVVAALAAVAAFATWRLAEDWPGRLDRKSTSLKSSH